MKVTNIETASSLSAGKTNIGGNISVSKVNTSSEMNAVILDVDKTLLAKLPVVAKVFNGHSPKLDGGTWWEYDDDEKKYVDTGVSAESNANKTFNSYGAASDYAANNEHAYVGQVLTVIEYGLATVYVISNESGDLSQVGGSSSESDYRALTNKPKINDVTLDGNKTSEDLNLDVTNISNFDIEALFL